MTGIRSIKRKNPFVQIDKRMLSDSSISWKSKGILSYLLSKPDDWVTYVSDLEKRSTDGRDSVRSGIEELEKAGYISRKRIRVKGQFKGWEYEVYECPRRIPTDNGKPDIGNSDDGETDIGESNTSNNDFSNNDLRDKEIMPDSTNPDVASLDYKDIINHLNTKANKSFRASSRATQRLIKARMNEGFKRDDFLRVIDNKSLQWGNDPKMVSYLRPETLFGSKFESYLNEKTNPVSGQAAYVEKNLADEFKLDLSKGEEEL